ncbi:MAG: ComEC/Rec2 family competence protein [Muribaculaceae bacterium]|nr:ComEC/Rec2 family competence protein [Muribaculaceae bacterium]
MRISLSSIPLFPILIGVVCGTIFDAILPSIFIIAIVICAVVAFIAKRNIIAIILLATTLGWGNSTIRNAPVINSEYLEKELIFEGTALSIQEIDEIRTIIVKIDAVKDSSSCKHLPHIKSCLYIPSLNPTIEVGDRISYLGELKYLKDRRDLPYEFDIVRHYNRKGIYTSSFIQPENITIIGYDNSWLFRPEKYRSNITHLIASLPLTSGCIEFLNATITGDTSMIGEEQRIKYSISGLAHILALSGLHVGIITFFIAFILYPINIVKGGSLRYAITIILLWIYAILTGLSPSVTRAVIMATIFLSAHILQRHHSPFNSLCLAAIILLSFTPESLYNIGFQLSFVAVASILLFAERLNPISRRKRILYNIVSIACVSMAAMIGTGIISAFYFHNFPVYFLFANIATSYLLPIIIIGGIIATISIAIGIDPVWLCHCIDFLYNIIDWLTSFITSLPGAQINRIYFNGWIILPYFAAIIALFVSIYKKKWRWSVLALSFGIFTIIMGYATQPRHNSTEYFIPRNSYYTNIIMRDTTAMYLISTSKGGDSIDALNKCVEKYENYIGWHDVDSILRIPTSFSSKRLYRRNNFVVVGNDVIYIIDNEDDLYPINIKPRYALVCRGFKGNVLDIYQIINPDTILLSSDLHKKRHFRYVDSCLVHDIPYISLRNTCFHRVVIE